MEPLLRACSTAIIVLLLEMLPHLRLCRKPRDNFYHIQAHDWIRDMGLSESAKRGVLVTVADRLLQAYHRLRMKFPCHDEAIETLVAASKFGQLRQRCRILSFVREKLHEGTAVHLQAEATNQLSGLLRLQGDVTTSFKLLSNFFDQSDIVDKLEDRPVLGLLHLSQAANYAYCSDFASADNEARKWTPPALSLTDKHLDVIWDQIHSAGKILRGRGNFAGAHIFFEKCLVTRHSHKRCLAMSHYADNCIELDYLGPGTAGSIGPQTLDRILSLIYPEIQRLRSFAPRSKGLRRLLLCMSEIYLQRGHFSDANIVLEELCDIYAGLPEPDIVDRLGHMRTYIALARTCPSSESEVRWIAALDLGMKYYPNEEDVFIVALIQLFICSARVETGDEEGGRNAFTRAAQIYHRRSPQFLIPGAGTYLLDEVRHRIQSLTGWILEQRRVYIE